MEVQTRIFENYNLDRLEDDINYFLRGVEKSKFIDLKLTDLNKKHIAVILYEKGLGYDN